MNVRRAFTESPPLAKRRARTSDIQRALARTIEMYDQRRSWFTDERESATREKAMAWLSKRLGICPIRAAVLIADALAERAARRAS